MNNNNIHLVKSAFHSQFIRAMEARDISADYYFKKAKLPSRVKDPESLLPIKSFYQLINIIAINENMPDFGSFVAQTTPWHKVLSLGPLIANSLNLKELLETFCESSSRQSSHVNFTLIDKGSHFDFCYTDTPVYNGDIQMELYRVTSMIQLIQIAAGAEWRPETIRLIIPKTKAANSCPLLTSSNISFSQPDTAVSIETKLLDLPVQLEIPEIVLTNNNGGSGADANIEFTNSIRQIIKTYTQKKSISIEELADITDLSVRTLQRRLKVNDLKFNDLLCQAKFDHAKERLHDMQTPIKEIAKSLGYSDAAHFTRAFHQWSGLSPTDFRKEISRSS